GRRPKPGALPKSFYLPGIATLSPGFGCVRMKDDAPPRSRDNEHSRQRRYHEARRRQPFIQHAYAGPRHPRAARQRALREAPAHGFISAAKASYREPTRLSPKRAASTTPAISPTNGS